MKKISAFLLSAFLIVSISVGVMAQGPFITSVDKIDDENVIKVVGTCANDKLVTIEVLKKGKEWTDVASADAANDVTALLNALHYFNQTLGENGEFEFEIYRLDENGEEIWAENEMPLIRVFSDGESNEYDYSKILDINKTTDVTTFQVEIVGTESTEDTENTNAKLKGDIKAIIDTLNNNDEKTEFWKKLFGYKESLIDRDSEGNVTGGFTRFDEIVSAAREIALLVRVGKTPTENLTNTEMPEVLAKFEEYGIMDSDSWSIYKNENEFDGEDYLTDTQERELYNLLKEKAIPNLLQGDTEEECFSAEEECFSAEEFVEYFNDAVVLTACQAPVGAPDDPLARNSDQLVKNIIEKSDVLANEDTGDFSSLGAADKLAVAGIINDAQTRCTSISELAKKIADNAKTYAGDGDTDGSDDGDTDDGDNDGYNPPPGGGGSGKNYAVEKVPQEDEETQSKKQFSDLAAHKWAEEAIYALQEKGIVQGTGDGAFEPARAVTREEFVKMLVLSADIFDTNASVHFQDAAEGAWYIPYVGSAYNARLINGITEDSFGIGKVITREQLAVMVYRALVSQGALQNVNATEPFEDIDTVSGFAVEAVNYVKAAGLMNGMGGGCFAPQENVNRAQAAKVIYELLQRL